MKISRVKLDSIPSFETLDKNGFISFNYESIEHIDNDNAISNEHISQEESLAKGNRDMEVPMIDVRGSNLRSDELSEVLQFAQNVFAIIDQASSCYSSANFQSQTSRDSKNNLSMFFRKSEVVENDEDIVAPPPQLMRASSDNISSRGGKSNIPMRRSIHSDSKSVVSAPCNIMRSLRNRKRTSLNQEKDHCALANDQTQLSLENDEDVVSVQPQLDIALGKGRIPMRRSLHSDSKSVVSTPCNAMRSLRNKKRTSLKTEKDKDHDTIINEKTQDLKKKSRQRSTNASVVAKPPDLVRASSDEIQLQLSESSTYNAPPQLLRASTDEYSSKPLTTSRYNTKVNKHSSKGQSNDYDHPSNVHNPTKRSSLNRKRRKGQELLSKQLQENSCTDHNCILRCDQDNISNSMKIENKIESWIQSKTNVSKEWESFIPSAEVHMTSIETRNTASARSA